MTRSRVRLVVLGALLFPIAGSSQSARRPAPRLEPVAETRLLMEGLASPNFKGVDRLLKAEPAEAEAWAFARGQSLLMAETANLLMLRPPRAERAETVWMERATELRDTATRLARAAAARDYARSRPALAAVAAACNRCHESFRIAHQIQLTDGVR